MATRAPALRIDDRESRLPPVWIPRGAYDRDGETWIVDITDDLKRAEALATRLPGEIATSYGEREVRIHDIGAARENCLRLGIFSIASGWVSSNCLRLGILCGRGALATRRSERLARPLDVLG